MQVDQLVRQLAAKGIDVVLLGGDVVLEVEGEARPTPEEKEMVREQREALRTYVLRRDLPPIARVRLDQLDRVLEVAVPWADYRLLITPGCAAARQLREVDAMPGRIWCVCEVLNMMLTGATRDHARMVAEWKALLAGRVENVSCSASARRA